MISSRASLPCQYLYFSTIPDDTYGNYCVILRVIFNIRTSSFFFLILNLKPPSTNTYRYRFLYQKQFRVTPTKNQRWLPFSVHRPILFMLPFLLLRIRSFLGLTFFFYSIQFRISSYSFRNSARFFVLFIIATAVLHTEHSALLP